jgi:hypothetical protein
MEEGGTWRNLRYGRVESGGTEGNLRGNRGNLGGNWLIG